MPIDGVFLGLDIGTSGARAVGIDANGKLVASGKATMAELGGNPRDPVTWWNAATVATRAALEGVERSRVSAICVDGTSGTLLAVDGFGEPLGDALMYNDIVQDADVLAAIARAAPASSAAHGASSGLAKAMALRRRGASRIVHQADWIASRFSGCLVTDANNALKSGYDSVADLWPDWIASLGFDVRLLPQVLAPGTIVGHITPKAVEAFGLPLGTHVVAGTTDGCASFLATGAKSSGDGVTSLGTTLTLKLLSDKPIFAPEYGVYSHRILGKWLAGGASNTGGGALLAHFTADEMAALTPRLNPSEPTGLGYYPLAKPGERFPVAEPSFAPRIEPRPADRAVFLQGLLEGIAEVEALGYRRLEELGAPPLKSMRSVGGGARNLAWRQIRAAKLKVPMLKAVADEAAYGAAVLAKAGR
jgi:sugar (pentulose or hexulose) kinase